MKFISNKLVAVFLTTLLSVACTKEEGPSEPIQPSDVGAVDPNAAALPADSEGPVDPAADAVDMGDMGDLPASDEVAGDDAVDAPLGTLTEDPWAAPGAPADIKDGPGTIPGEDISSAAGADTSGIPSYTDGSSASGAVGSDPGYKSGPKKSKSPKTTATAASKKKKDKAQNKVAKTKKSKQAEAAALAAGSSDFKASAGTGSSVRYVKAIQLNIRSAPDRKASKVRRLKGGDQVKVTIEGAWAKLGEGEYVRTKFLSSKAQRIVSEEEVEAAWAAKRNNGKSKKSSATSGKSKSSKKSKAKNSKSKKTLAPAQSADQTGDTSLPPDPNAPAIENQTDEQMDGDQEPAN